MLAWRNGAVLRMPMVVQDFLIQMKVFVFFTYKIDDMEYDQSLSKLYNWKRKTSNVHYCDRFLNTTDKIKLTNQIANSNIWKLMNHIFKFCEKGSHLFLLSFVPLKIEALDNLTDAGNYDAFEFCCFKVQTWNLHYIGVIICKICIIFLF